MTDVPTRLATAMAALAQANAVVPSMAEPMTMLFQAAPQLVFGIAVYYMLIRSQDKTASDIKNLADKFEATLDRVTERFEKQQGNLVQEMKLSAQQDRDQHSRLFGDFLQMTKDVVGTVGTLKQEFITFKAEQQLILENRRRSGAGTAPEFRGGRPGDADDTPVIAAPRG